jgi:hypothetical protein
MNNDCLRASRSGQVIVAGSGFAQDPEQPLLTKPRFVRVEEGEALALALR